MKKFRSVIVFLLTGLLLTSCLGRSVPSLSETPSGKAETAAPKESPEASSEGEEGAPQEAEEAEEVPEEEIPAWAGMTFLLGDTSLTLPFSFGEIGDTWSVDPENDILPADTVLSPGERTMDNVPLISESWGEMLVTAGFVNLSGKELPLKE